MKKVKNEKVLKNRRKAASRGKVIRVSDTVWNYLNDRRLNSRTSSWDKFFRSVFGLKNRKGEEQPLVTGWLEVNTGRFYLKQAEANGAAVVAAARAGIKKYVRPIKMREIRW